MTESHSVPAMTESHSALQSIRCFHSPHAERQGPTKLNVEPALEHFWPAVLLAVLHSAPSRGEGVC